MGTIKSFFPNYGEGEVAWRGVYENLSDVPKDARYEHGLYEEFDLILHKQKMGETTRGIRRCRGKPFRFRE